MVNKLSLFIFLIFGFLSLNAQTPDANGIIYVTENGNGNGSSWANATANLQGAINATGVTKVFVAVGNYNAPSGSFSMKKNVNIYGGFDPTNHIKTLNDNRILPNKGMGDGSVLNGQNQRTVIINDNNQINPFTGNSTLDGFTITGGNTTNYGGGIYNYNVTPIFNNLVIRNNTANTGGGIFNKSSSPTISNIIIQYNIATTGGGGAIYNQDALTLFGDGTINISNALIKGNTCNVINASSVMTSTNVPVVMTNTLIADNIGSLDPLTYSGTYTVVQIGKTLTMNNVTSAKNIGFPAYGIIGATAIFNNSIILGTIKTSDGGSFTAKYSFLPDATTSVADGNVQKPQTWGWADLFTNYNGGDYTLSSNSFVADKGSNVLFPGLNANSTDLVGSLRLMGTTIDLGAYERIILAHDANGIIYVKPSATGNKTGSDWDNATDNLQNAINATDAAKVFVAVGNYNVSSSISMKNGVEIYGGFDPDNNIKTLSQNRIMPSAVNTAQGSILNGQNARSVIYNSNNGVTSSALLDGFTITGGSATNGAGMFNYLSSPTLRNLVFRNNKASESGGGMYSYSSHPSISNSVFTSNSVISTSGSPVYGGGIYSANTATPIVITNVTVVGNVVQSSGSEYGAGICNSTADTQIYNCIIWGNTKQISGTTAGADIEKIGSSIITVKNSITQNYTTGNIADNNLTNANPLFTNVSGGNYTLQATSPAITAGSNVLYIGLNENTKDLAGNPRLSGSSIDMGAYEYQKNITPIDGTVYVKPIATGNGKGSSWANATSNLHDAIDGEAVQKVFVAVGEYKVGTNSFMMKNNVEIYGGFDPDHNIKTLNDTRIFPSELPSDGGVGEGSVLNGENIRPVIWNSFSSTTTLNNTAVLDGFTITNGKNTGTGGGGITNQYASPTLRNLVIKNNTASTSGGGIYNNSSSAMNLNNAVIKNNTAQYGGGIYNNSSDAVLTNVSIIGNSATLTTAGAGGGGVFNQNSALKLTNVVITNNSTGFQGGGFRNLSGNPIFTNVTLANNTAGVNYSAMEIVGGSPQLNNSIVYGVIAGIFNAQYTLIEGSSSVINGNIDATGISIADIFTDYINGDYTLKPASPAINVGNNSLFVGLDINSKDLIGNKRIYNNDIIDLGAFESLYNTPLVADAEGIIYVKETSIGNSSGKNWDNATSDLQSAIQTSGVQKVFVAIGNYNAPATSFVMKNGVEIYGGFDPDHNIKTLSDTRILPSELPSGGGVGDGSVLNGRNTRPVVKNAFSSTTVINNTAVLDGFTIVNGKFTGTGGGGITNQYASPTLRNLVIKNNTASTSGGGIYNNSSSAMNLSNAVIKNNTAQYGGGIYNNTSDAVLTNVSIIGNSATLTTAGAGGGGVFNQNSTLKLTNVVITNNSTGFQGGGFRNLSGNPIFTNVTLANNTAAVNYSAMEIVGGTTQLNNTIIYGTVAGIYNAKYSLIQGNTDFTNGNIDATAYTLNDIFTNPSNGDYTLKNFSPSVNSGSNILYAGIDANTKDLAGNARIHYYNNFGIIDLGAYESNYETIVPTSGIVYVKESPAGLANGSSWDNATSDLQSAINTTGVQKVFVAKGEYLVGTSSFVMKNGVEIYGGFDPDNNIKTLNDTRILPNRGTDEGSVLKGEHTVSVINNVFSSETRMDYTAVLDGFTIKDGYDFDGGGMNNTYASPSIVNCRFIRNSALYSGGAIYNAYSSSPTVSDCVFTGNIAEGGGAISNNFNSSPILTNCKFIQNSANIGGAIIFASGSSPTFINCNITENTATTEGGGVYNMSVNGTFINVTTVNNGNNGFYAAGNTILRNSIIWDVVTGGNNYTANYSLIKDKSDTSNGNIDPTGITATDLFTNPATGDYTLKNGAVAIDAGNNAYNATTTDLVGNQRIMGIDIDLGAYEFQGDPSTLPVTLLNFTAKDDGNRAKLQWQTANEVNHKDFEIYRSSDDGVFVKIGEVKTDNYLSPSNTDRQLRTDGQLSVCTFTDKQPLNGNNYYKLVQIDKDGKTTDLGVRMITFNLNLGLSLNLYPNPTTNKFTATFEAGKFSQLEVTDVTGKVLQHIAINNTENSKQVSVLNYPAGLYLVRLSGNGKIESRRLVKR